MITTQKHQNASSQSLYGTIQHGSTARILQRNIRTASLKPSLNIMFEMIYDFKFLRMSE